MSKIRLPLSVPTEYKSDDLQKGPELTNAFIDSSKSQTLYAVKRPGFYVGSEAITTGTNRGIFVNPNAPDGSTEGDTKLWYIGDDGSGNPVLGSISSPFTPPEPPADETLIMQATASYIPSNPPSGDYQQISYANPTSTHGFAIVQQYYPDDISGSLTLLMYYVYPGSENNPVFAYSGSPQLGTFKITKDSENVYYYINNILVATAPYQFTGYSLTYSLNFVDTIFGPPEA